MIVYEMRKSVRVCVRFIRRSSVISMLLGLLGIINQFTLLQIVIHNTKNRTRSWRCLFNKILWTFKIMTTSRRAQDVNMTSY